LTLIGGTISSNTAGGFGGGVYNDVGRMTIRGSTVVSNTANGPGGGGGIYNDGDMILANTSISQNIASQGDGGGIHNIASATLSCDNCTIRNNRAGGVGGGISDSSISIVSLSNSSVISNTTAGAGGGIHNAATLQISNTVVADNLVLNSTGPANGGGIANIGQATIQASQIRGNRAVRANTPGDPQANGGGIIHQGGVLTITDSLISDNVLEDQQADREVGGGIFSDDNLKLTIRNTTISDHPSGGGIYIDEGGQAVLEDLIIRNNQSRTAAGGIFAGSGAIVQIAGANVISNTSGAQGGGINLANNTVATLTDVVVGDNQSAAEAGGIYIGASTLPTATVVISHAVVANNRAGGYGGGIESWGNLTISNSQIISNTTPSAGGGIDNLGALTVTNSLISANRLENPIGDGISGGAREWGGGIWSRQGSTLVVSGTIISNHDVGGDPGFSDGGGIALADHMTAVLADVTISGNQVLGSGGGIWAESGTSLTITGSTISGNRLKDVGPAGCPLRNCNEGAGISGGGTISIANSTISGNHSDNIAGGIFWQGNVSATLDHVTLASNTANHGGGIWRNGVEPIIHIRNSIIAGNTSIITTSLLSSDCEGSPTSDGHNLFGIAGECAPTPSDLAGTEAQPLDPMLGALADNGGPTLTQALLAGSPAIDAGGVDCSPTDQRGAARPYGAFCDIGAYELGAPLDSGLGANLADKIFAFDNPAGKPDEKQFLDDFHYAATTHLITETHVLSDISALDQLNLPISLEALDVQAVLPLTATGGLTTAGQLVPNPSAYLYLQIVKTLYDDENLRYYDGTIRSGLCAGMTTTVADFNRPAIDPSDPPPVPSTYGGDNTVRSIPLDPPSDQVQSAREFIQLYHGRQLGSQVLNWLATVGQGTLDARGLYARIASRIGSLEWLSDPEIIGITKGANCEDFEVGHALLPYRVEAQGNSGRIYVYDPNYSSTSGSAEDHYIEIDFATNSWTYALSPQAIWNGRTIYSTPLHLFREKPTLPAMTDTDVVLVNGGHRPAWGGHRPAWGGHRPAWGEVEDTTTRTGCYVSADGTTLFLRDITGSLRVFPLTGPRIPDPNGGSIFPETLFFPAGSDMTFTTVGGQVSDLLVFGHHTVLGFLGTARDTTRDSLDVDKDFYTMRLRTSDADPQKQITLYQMHETDTANPDISETRVYAVSNVGVQGGEALTMTVAPTLNSFEIVNTGEVTKEMDIGFAGIGHSGVSSVVIPDQPIGGDERRVYIPSSWADLDQGTIRVEIYDADDGTHKGSETLTPPSFPLPSSRMLDRFDRNNGPLGVSWSGARGSNNYIIQNNQVQVRAGGPIYWKNERFGQNQEAFVTLTGITPHADQQGILLKVQGRTPQYREGAIKVIYDTHDRAVRVATYQKGRGWQQVARFRGVVFENGDQLGGRALSDGRVEVYRNGTLVGVADTSKTNGDYFVKRGGWIGLWYNDASRATFDNIGGGTVQP
jgi:hypothetical protein